MNFAREKLDALAVAFRRGSACPARATPSVAVWLWLVLSLPASDGRSRSVVLFTQASAFLECGGPLRGFRRARRGGRTRNSTPLCRSPALISKRCLADRRLLSLPPCFLVSLPHPCSLRLLTANAKLPSANTTNASPSNASVRGAPNPIDPYRSTSTCQVIGFISAAARNHFGSGASG